MDRKWFTLSPVSVFRTRPNFPLYIITTKHISIQAFESCLYFVFDKKKMRHIRNPQIFTHCIWSPVPSPLHFAIFQQPKWQLSIYSFKGQWFLYWFLLSLIFSDVWNARSKQSQSNALVGRINFDLFWVSYELLLVPNSQLKHFFALSLVKKTMTSWILSWFLVSWFFFYFDDIMTYRSNQKRIWRLR